MGMVPLLSAVAPSPSPLCEFTGPSSVGSPLQPVLGGGCSCPTAPMSLHVAVRSRLHPAPPEPLLQDPEKKYFVVFVFLFEGWVGGGGGGWFYVFFVFFNGFGCSFYKEKIFVAIASFPESSPCHVALGWGAGPRAGVPGGSAWAAAPGLQCGAGAEPWQPGLPSSRGTRELPPGTWQGVFWGLCAQQHHGSPGPSAHSPALVPLPQPSCPGTIFPWGSQPRGANTVLSMLLAPRAFEPAVVDDDFYIFFS